MDDAVDKSAEKTVAGAGRIDLHRGKGRDSEHAAFPVHGAARLTLGDDDAAKIADAIEVEEGRLVGWGLEEADSGKEVREAAVPQADKPDGPVRGIEYADQGLRVHEHDAAQVDHPWQGRRRDLSGHPHGDAEVEGPLFLRRKIAGRDRVARADAPEQAVSVVNSGPAARREVRVE